MPTFVMSGARLNRKAERSLIAADYSRPCVKGIGSRLDRPLVSSVPGIRRPTIFQAITNMLPIRISGRTSALWRNSDLSEMIGSDPVQQ